VALKYQSLLLIRRRGSSKHKSFRRARNLIDGSRGTSHAYSVGIEIFFESEFDPVVKWAIRAFNHDALDQSNRIDRRGLTER
jgi:hypothetical protein